VDRVLGLASIGVGLLATVVVAVAISADYWLHTDEPIDTELTPPPGMEPPADDLPPPAADSDEADVVGPPSSVVAMVATHSGLWRFCVVAKLDFTGRNIYVLRHLISVICDVKLCRSILHCMR